MCLYNGIWQKLIENGAQYIFVQGIPPLGCSPSILTIRASVVKEDYDETNYLIPYNDLSIFHNKLLQNILVDLMFQYPQVTLVYGDSYNIAFEKQDVHNIYFQLLPCNPHIVTMHSIIKRLPTCEFIIIKLPTCL